MSVDPYFEGIFTRIEDTLNSVQAVVDHCRTELDGYQNIVIDPVSHPLHRFESKMQIPDLDLLLPHVVFEVDRLVALRNE